MRRVLNPRDVASPAGGDYHHGLIVTAPREFARLAGQIGMRPDGSVPPDIESQSEEAWNNIERILAEAGMTVADICKVTTYVAGVENIAAYRAVHVHRTAGHAPPWTLVPLPTLGGEQFLVEVDVEAMR
jgi:2-iminobutanoate/2-iminopropanoate deaminase